MRNHKEFHPTCLHLHYKPNIAWIGALDNTCPLSNLKSVSIFFGQSNGSYMVINVNRKFDRNMVRVDDSRHHQKKVLEFWVHSGFNVNPTLFRTMCKGSMYLMSVVCKLEKCKNSLLFNTKLVGYMRTCKRETRAGCPTRHLTRHKPQSCKEGWRAWQSTFMIFTSVSQS